MNTETVIRAGTSDLVALAFYRVGYRPRESLVIVGTAGPRHTAGLVARVDLPPARDRRAVVRSTLDMIRREGHDHAVALVVSDAVVGAGRAVGGSPPKLPHRALVRELDRQAGRLGLPLIDVLAVGPSSWRSYRCDDPACCPPGGHPLDEALTGRLAARLVSDGHVLAPDEQALVADVEPQPGSAEPGSAEPGAAEPVAGEAGVGLERWRALLADPARVTVGDLAWLAEALQDRWLRDAVLLTLLPGSGSLPEVVAAGADPDVVDPLLDTADPDDDLLERGRLLLAAVARTAPPGRRADALALLAWAAWWSGQGARGRLLAGRALADVPGHRLARLVDQLLVLGVPPGWAARRRGRRGESSPERSR